MATNSRLVGPALLPQSAASIVSTVGGTTLTQLLFVNGPIEQIATIWIGPAIAGNELFRQKLRALQTLSVPLTVTLNAEEELFGQADNENSCTVIINCST